MKAIVFGLMFGAGFQAWRNYPPDGLLTPSSAWLACCIAVVCAYLAGRGRGGSRSSATATAVASASAVVDAAATSQATINLAIVNPGAGSGAAPAGMQVPEWGAVPWMGERRELASIEDLDAYEVADILGAEETSHDRA